VFQRAVPIMTAQRQTRWWRKPGSLAGLFLVAVSWAAPGLAQEAEVVTAGKREFRQHCAVCHGLGGTGDSVMVNLNLLTVKPTDLTQLKKRHKGTFPFWHVYRIVDGREPVKGHGTADMPIWGNTFQEKEGTSLAAETRISGRILQLVYYLQSIQEK
jgi:mono/diheme cytochrome c family protein